MISALLLALTPFSISGHATVTNDYVHIRCGTRLSEALTSPVSSKELTLSRRATLPKWITDAFNVFLETNQLPKDPLLQRFMLRMHEAHDYARLHHMPSWLEDAYILAKVDREVEVDPTLAKYFDHVDERTGSFTNSSSATRSRYQIGPDSRLKLPNWITEAYAQYVKDQRTPADGRLHQLFLRMNQAHLEADLFHLPDWLRQIHVASMANQVLPTDPATRRKLLSLEKLSFR